MNDLAGSRAIGDPEVTPQWDSAPEQPAPGNDPPARRSVRFDCTDPDDTAALEEAASAARRALEAGECIVLPTDTVYGIGADAFDADAVQRLLDAKGRGRDMPPPVLIADSGLVQALAFDVPDEAQQLLNALWPGGLTAIFESRTSSRMDLGETHGTVGLRVPDHALTRELLRQTGPLAVSSANRHGQPAASTCDQAIGQLGDRVTVYLDGGELTGTQGKPSTIIDFSRTSDGEVLRSGAIDLDMLRQYLPELTDLSPADSGPVERDWSVAQLKARHTLQPGTPVGDGQPAQIAGSGPVPALPGGNSDDDQPTADPGADPSTDPAADRSGADPPGADRPDTDRPDTDRPDTDRPDTDRPGAADRPDTPPDGRPGTSADARTATGTTTNA